MRLVVSCSLPAACCMLPDRGCRLDGCVLLRFVVCCGVWGYVACCSWFAMCSLLLFVVSCRLYAVCGQFIVHRLLFAV